MDDLTASLRAALAAPLPGLEAQVRLAPRPRVGWDPHHIPAGLRHAAALILLYPHRGELHLPLTVRGGGLRTHTGQVALPGGAVDAGETIEAAAVREAVEEVGVDATGVDIVGHLSPLHIPVSGFLLHPVVGVTRARPDFHPSADEVARLLEVPLAWLAADATIRTEWQQRQRHGTLVDVEVPYFDVEGEKVWGTTAMVLAEFLSVTARARIG